jgi:hypothetical protein
MRVVLVCIVTLLSMMSWSMMMYESPNFLGFFTFSHFSIVITVDTFVKIGAASLSPSSALKLN